MHADMHWIARDPERRSDPGRVLPGARSLLLVALDYDTGDPTCVDRRRGRISRYAWGEEYHRVVGERLETLERRARQIVPGAGIRRYVDTGPVLEKAWAERAGLGWIGKHTNLIHPRAGSWFFLGALMLDVDLGPATSHPDRCGSCTACIDACPTGAIVAPYVLDARLCIAYLTIENRGPIPRNLRAAIGNRVFGCDDCQDVCPWNRHAARSRLAAHFAPRDGLRTPSLRALLSLDAAGFRERFRDSPIARARWPGFLRNVAVALGNSSDRRAIPDLIRALSHPEPLVRGHAAWALERVAGESARRPLEDRLEREADELVREEIEVALESLSALRDTDDGASTPC